MRFLPFLFEQVNFPSIEAGHQYDFDDVPDGEPSGEDGEGGIGTPWILALVFLALVVVALFVSLNASGAIAKLKKFGPKAMILVLIAAPLIAWAAFSSGDEKSLIIERWTNDAGAPELIVSLGEDDLNTLETTNGKRAVRVECVGREGQVVLDAKLRWPFVNDPGYDDPHVHQAASREQLQRADHCRLRGTRVRLEADVTGP